MQKVQELKNKITGGEAPKHKLPTRKLGRYGPEVTSIGYGTMGLSAFYGPPMPDEKRFEVLDKVYAEGDLFWDSADIYMDSEDLIGKWFERNPGKREHIFFATKFANKVDADGNRSVDSSPEYCLQSCEKSLRRLGIKQIDLYYAHRLDGVTPVEKTMEALKQLKQQGKIKYIGLSEVSSDSLRRACKVEHVDAVQMEYSPFALEIETEGLLKTARELGVAIVAYSPIGRGMLGGAIRSPDDFPEGDFRRFAPRFQPDNFKKNLELVDKIGGIAKEKGVTSSQLTLAWILAQGEDFFPIPGTTKIPRIVENLEAAKIKLGPSEEKVIRDACEAAEVQGGRYPEGMDKVLFADTPPLS